MKKLYKLLFASVLTLAAILSMPRTSAATDWCGMCGATGDCNACCRCDGGGPGYCFIFCNGA